VPYGAPPAGGAKGTSNGMAIAALVLGILSFVCLGPIAGVLAIVFGILGMKKANEVGTGKGMAIAGMVLGIIGTIVTILIFVFVIAAGDSVNDALDDATGAADPSDYELVNKSCEIDNYGFVTFSGTIENTGSKDLDFTIDGEIRDNSNVIVDSPSTIVSVPEGDTVQWELVSSVDDSITQVECKVTSVNNWFN
jgi:TM2 domain-containing membrane protein YozV